MLPGMPLSYNNVLFFKTSTACLLLRLLWVLYDFQCGIELTCGGPCSGPVIIHAWDCAELRLPPVVHGNPLHAVDGLLILCACLNVYWLLGNGVLNGVLHRNYYCGLTSLPQWNDKCPFTAEFNSTSLLTGQSKNDKCIIHLMYH